MWMQTISKTWEQIYSWTQWGGHGWNKNLTKETDSRVKKYSEARIGIKFSDERCKNISEALTGGKHSDKHCRNRSNSLKGREAWNEGLTKETDERLRKSGESVSKTHKKRGISIGKNNPFVVLPANCENNPHHILQLN